MIRVAQMNNKDIDAMTAEVSRLESRQDELQARYASQVRRWKNYREAFDAIMIQFKVNQGALPEDELAQLLPGFTGK